MKVWHVEGVAGSKQKVLLATPAYGDLCPEYVMSLFQGQQALIEAGISAHLMILAGNCHVDDSRNRLVRDFLDTDCTDMVFIDSDVRYHGKDLVKLVSYDRDVVAGVYPFKQNNEDYPVRLLPGDLTTDADGLLEVKSVPTGFLRIKRHVLELLASKVPGFHGKKDSPSSRKMPLIFERTLEGQTRWGGDYEFCRKWKAEGGKIYVDPEMDFGHVGNSEWYGSLSSFLLRKNGLNDVYIKRELRKLERGEDIDFNILWEAWNNLWAAMPDFLITMHLMAKETTGIILEVGSGLSTLILGASTKQPIYVLENDLEWAEKMHAWITSMGWNHVHIYHCPIKDYGEFNWYEIPDDLPEFDFIVCDGPRNKLGRYGLVPILGNHFRNGARIIADDFDQQRSNFDKWGYPYHVMGDRRRFAVIEVRDDRKAVNQ
jgi:hypothetical protein